MKTLKWICVLAMIPMLWACSTDEEPEITVPEGNEDYFQTPLEFDCEAGSKAFTFSTNGNWAIDLAATRSDDNWATVSPMSGKKGVNTITVTVEANTAFRDRSMTLALTVGTLSKEIVINQTQVPVPPDEYHPHPVDLGLEIGTKWASCNVGASKPEEYGDYYAWARRKSKRNIFSRTTNSTRIGNM